MFREWSDAFVTDVRLMDKEHKEIMSRAKELHETLLLGNTVAFQKGFVELLLMYVNTHLVHEEELQRVIGFYLYEEHKEHHDYFRKWTKDLREQLKHEVLSQEELLLLDYELNDWLSNHILIEDMKIADYHHHRKAHTFNP